MKINKAGLELIKKAEGCRLYVYDDSGVDGDGIKTAGFGTTGVRVMNMKFGDKISQAQADTWLMDDIQRYQNAISKHTADLDLTLNQFSALVSFTYNIGVQDFLTSTLLAKLKKEDFEGVLKEFPRWNKQRIKGKTVIKQWLVKRRKAELTLFSTPDGKEDIAILTAIFDAKE